MYEDLRPYVCTFPHCEPGLFASRRLWFEHELAEHRRSWTCQFCEHQPYRSSEQLKAHLAAAHEGQCEDTEMLALIAESSSQPLANICADACPLCNDKWYTVPQDLHGHTMLVVSIEDFRKHLGTHLEKLALFAIPLAFEGNSTSTSHASASAEAVSALCLLSI